VSCGKRFEGVRVVSGDYVYVYIFCLLFYATNEGFCNRCVKLSQPSKRNIFANNPFGKDFRKDFC
jgi:hypothetical protein